MKYKLSVKERLVLSGLLPPEGDATTLKIVRDLQGELAFSEEEQAATKMSRIENKEGNSTIVWDTSVVLDKDVELGPKAMSVVVERLESLEKSKRLNMNQFELYERFVLNNVPSFGGIVKEK